MGYQIELRGAEFKIKKSNVDQALQALKEFVKNKRNTFIDVPGVENSKTLEKAMLSCRFVLDISTEKQKPLPTKEEILKDVSSALKMVEEDMTVGSNKSIVKDLLIQAEAKLTAKPEDMILVTGISFEGESQDGSEEAMFQSIAPFVEADSYIEMQGEAGEIWRWVFDGTTCVEKVANLNF